MLSIECLTGGPQPGDVHVQASVWTPSGQTRCQRHATSLDHVVCGCV